MQAEGEESAVGPHLHPIGGQQELTQTVQNRGLLQLRLLGQIHGG